MRPHRRFTILCSLTLPLAFVSCGGGDVGEESEAPPTENAEALAAFEAANDFWARPGATPEDVDSTVANFELAVELDPEFTLAYVYLANTQAYVHQMWDRDPARQESAFMAAQRAVELNPEMPETQGALGTYYYRVAKEYDQALEAFQAGEALDPESDYLVRMQAHTERRRGNWDQARELLIRAESLRSTMDGLQALAENHMWRGEYAEAEEYYNTMLERDPELTGPQSSLAWIQIYRDGDTDAVREFLATQPEGWVGARWNLEMLDHDFEAALAVLGMPGADPLVGQYGISPRALLAGITHGYLGNEAERQAAYEEARETLEAMLPEREQDPRVHLALGQVYAGLGMKDAAIQEGQRAVELVPPERDALVGPNNVFGLAVIYASVDEPELAAEQLQMLLSMPSTVTRPLLAIHPAFDGIREHSSFQAMMEG